MKKALLLIAFLIPAGLFAQSTAMDFTKNDCNTGALHNLFSELDSNYVIIMEFVMIPTCTPCSDAYHFMEPVVNSYSASHPGRLRIYQIAYNNAYTCSAMNTWATDYNMTSTRFIQGGSEVTYYGGMGMPTVVIASTAAHTVFGKWIGFLEADTTAFREAIDSALFVIENGVVETGKNNNIKIYPSPSSDVIRISIDDPAIEIESIHIFDVSGKLVLNHTLLNPATMEINVASLADGMYFMRLETKNGQQLTEKFQVSHQ